MLMLEIILAIGVAVFIVYVAFSIAFLMSMKRTSDAVHEFVKNNECALHEALSGLKDTLEEIRKVSGDVGAVTSDVRRVSHAMAGLERGMGILYGYLRSGLGPAAGAKLAGLRAGITAGVTTLVKNSRRKRRDSHERV
jgi:hypothetical protein